MINKNLAQLIGNQLSESIDFCVWENSITEGIIKSTIEASILFLGYLKQNRRTSTVVFTNSIDNSFLFCIKSTFLNDGNENIYVLSMSYEEENEGDEDVYYFIDTPELARFLKIYAEENYGIYYSNISPGGSIRDQEENQIIFYIISIVFECLYNFINDISLSNGILEIKDCALFKYSQGGIKIKFLANTKQLFKSDKFTETLNMCLQE